MLKIRQIPTHLNGRKSSCAKVNLSLSTQQQRSYLRWNFTKLLLEWPGLKLGLTSYLPIERKEVFAATDRGFTARRRLRLRLSPQTHSHFGKDTQDAMSRFFWQNIFIPAGGGGGRGANTHQTHEMTVPNEIIGCVIGKGGSKIAEIRWISKQEALLRHLPIPSLILHK